MFVALHKGFKKRPWQAGKGISPDIRAAQIIESRNVTAYSAAFHRLVAQLQSQEIINAIERAWRNGLNPSGVLAAIPFYDAGRPDRVALWSRFGTVVATAYRTTMTEAGQQSYKELGLQARFSLQKATRKPPPPQSPLIVETSGKAGAQVPIIPPNPYSIAWIQTRTHDLLQKVSNSQKEMLRLLFEDAYLKGLRVEEVMAAVRQMIGLTPREFQAVQRTAQTMTDAGAAQSAIDRATNIQSERLLDLRAERISRTEVFAAINSGRQDSWMAAVDEGLLPATAMRVWSSADEARTCVICTELSAHDPVGIDEPFYSNILEQEVMNPPMDSHPNCRCAVYLIFPGED